MTLARQSKKIQSYLPTTELALNEIERQCIVAANNTWKSIDFDALEFWKKYNTKYFSIDEYRLFYRSIILTLEKRDLKCKDSDNWDIIIVSWL
jgi:hypothetical protein